MVEKGRRSAHRWYRVFPSKLKEWLWLREASWNSQPAEDGCRSPTALGASSHANSLDDLLLEELRPLHGSGPFGKDGGSCHRTLVFSRRRFRRRRHAVSGEIVDVFQRT